ncbi:hypothetical protein T11_13750, partial [Trichinella zimbabwensis]
MSIVFVWRERDKQMLHIECDGNKMDDEKAAGILLSSAS